MVIWDASERMLPEMEAKLTVTFGSHLIFKGETKLLGEIDIADETMPGRRK